MADHFSSLMTSLDTSYHYSARRDIPSFQYNKLLLIFSIFGPRRGNATQPIWLTDIVCSTSQPCITDCQRCPASSYLNCQHSQDVTVECCEYYRQCDCLTVMQKLNLEYYSAFLTINHIICCNINFLDRFA